MALWMALKPEQVNCQLLPASEKDPSVRRGSIDDGAPSTKGTTSPAINGDWRCRS